MKSSRKQSQQIHLQKARKPSATEQMMITLVDAKSHEITIP